MQWLWNHAGLFWSLSLCGVQVLLFPGQRIKSEKIKVILNEDVGAISPWFRLSKSILSQDELQGWEYRASSCGAPALCFSQCPDDDHQVVSRGGELTPREIEPFFYDIGNTCKAVHRTALLRGSVETGRTSPMNLHPFLTPSSLINWKMFSRRQLYDREYLIRLVT